MSIANYTFDRQRAIVVSDTLNTLDGIPHHYSAKAELLICYPAILVTRGLVYMGDKMRDYLDEMFFPGGFDEMMNEVPDFLAGTAIRLRNMRPDLATEKFLEAHVIGLSKKRKGLTAFRFTEDNHFEPEELEPGTHVHPYPESAPKPPAYISDAKHGELAETQQAVMQKQAEADGKRFCCVGGDLWMFELKPKGFTGRRFYRFKNYKETTEAMKHPLEVVA